MATERLRTVFRHLQGASALNDLNVNAVSAALATGSEFEYTLNNDRLTWSQRKFYEENGYLVIRHLVDDELLDECSQRFVDLCEGRVPKGNMTLMKDISLAKTEAKGEYLYNKAQDIVWDEVLSKYILLPQLLDYVECFTGPNIAAIHSMLINKPPDSGKMTSIHPLHQDLHYFPFRPANRIVASWTAIEKVTLQNGCLVVIPGSHKGALQPHDYPDLEHGVNKAYHGVRGFDDQPKLALEMEKGDTVFFHPILIHGSGVNTTKGFRKAISAHYAASECNLIDVRGTTQENVAIEIEEMAKRKGMNVDFQMLWKLRSRLVKGEEINM